MGLVDQLGRGRQVAGSRVAVDIEFSDEEQAAIERNLSMYQSASAAPPGYTLAVPTKTRDCMIAQALRYYAADLMRLVAVNPARSDVSLLLDKAIQALIKSYAAHNLPAVLYQLGVMIEMTGDVERSREFFKLFLDQEEAFKPDEIDRTFQATLDFDAAEAIEKASAKLR